MNKPIKRFNSCSAKSIKTHRLMRFVNFLKCRKTIPFFLHILVLISISSCTAQENDMPYKVGTSYYFEVSIIENNDTIVADTLKYEIKKKGFIGRLLGINMAIWSSAKNLTYNEKRGINLSKDRIEIQTPLKLSYLDNENIVIAGYPTYSATMKVGYKSEASHTFVKGYGVLSGKTLKQSSTIADSSFCTYKDELCYCKVSTGQNDNYHEEFGLFKIKTYYHEKHGFIRMEFTYPTGKIIVFQLVKS